MAYLLIQNGPQADSYYPLRRRESTTVGRLAGVDFQIQGDSAVSRKHLLVSFNESHHEACAIKSQDKELLPEVTVNKIFIAETVALQDGDVIGIGNTKLLYMLDLPSGQNQLNAYKDPNQGKFDTVKNK